MPDQIFDLMAQHDYEHLFYCQDKQVGLKAIIAIHETMVRLLALAHEQHIPTYRAADVLAEQRIAQATQRNPGGFHDWRR